jgi:hypothetical protein
MSIPRKLIMDLLDASDEGMIQTQIVVSGGIFSGALCDSEEYGTEECPIYEFAMAVPSPSGEPQVFKLNLAGEAIMGIATPPREESNLITPGRSH